MGEEQVAGTDGRGRVARLRALLSHPRTLKARTFVRRVVATCAVILAVSFVTTVSVDVGPLLKEQAERGGSALLDRPMTIGNLQVRLWDGSYVIEDLFIGGPTPDAIPFLTAGRIVVKMPWSTLFNRRVVFESIEMTDWHMHAEARDGGHTFPDFTPDGDEDASGGGDEPDEGGSGWTTTLAYVRAHRGEFTFQDFGTPWGIIVRNLDVTVARPGGEYVGRATFHDGLTMMQNFVPFRTDMDAAFTIDGGRVLFDRIDLTTEGIESVLVGDANLAFWPEMMFSVRSTIQLPTMRELFFADDDFTMTGVTGFDGVFHVFRETLEDGTARNGRELKGTFSIPRATVNQYRFDGTQGFVRWTPDRLEVTDATTDLYGGHARFRYRMAPLGSEIPGVATLDAEYDEVDLETLTRELDLQGVRLAGRASGRNLLEWPLGDYGGHTGGGAVRVTPPPGVTLMTRRMPLDRIEAREEASQLDPVAPLSTDVPVPIGGEVTYAYGPELVEIESSRVATETTLVEFEGVTAYGDRSRIPFHVSSADWQESDRLLAGLMTAFGAPTGPIPIGGYGTFDGEMRDAFSRPRIEGRFVGDRMRAWDVTWGAIAGDAVIADGYVDVSDVTIGSGARRIRTAGRFSVGGARDDGGREIDARVEVAGWPLADLRHAFRLDEYDVDGTLDGEFDVRGAYARPGGFGQMTIRDGLAYGEPFERASADVRLEEDGVRLEDIEVLKGGGSGSGAALVGWDGTYSFNLIAQAIPLQAFSATEASDLPLSGLVDCDAGGSGAFAAPRYDVTCRLRDVFVGDEGIGQIVADLGIDDDVMTVQLDAASPRLQVSGIGRVSLTPGYHADLSVSVTDTSLDPYVRVFQPQLSPFTTAVASGSMRVEGPLTDVDRLLVDATVDRLDVSLFDYPVRNDGQIRLALDRHTVKVSRMRIVGDGTQLDVSGTIDLHDNRIAVETTGDANLAVLQGFIADIRSSGLVDLSATLEGALDDPAVNGTFAIADGRIRHFALPHSISDLNGAARFDDRGVSLEGLTGRLAEGNVTFGGRIDKDGYLPGRLDVTVQGTGMRLRLLEGMRSRVDANLALRGTTEAATLSGDVVVDDAVYRQPFATTGGLLELATGGGDEGASSAPAPLARTLPLSYDIRITAPSTLHVRNSNLRLTASADMELLGTFDRPLVFGRAEAASGGELVFEGRRYRLRRGTIDFNNPTRIEPFIDFELETRVRAPGETYRVTVRATGPWAAPAIELESDPPLSDSDVLALLFGDIAPGQDVEFRRYNTVTPEQQLVQERLARELTGAFSSEVGRAVEETFGIDTFQVSPSLVSADAQSSRLDPGARLTIVQRISDRLYLTYLRSVSASTHDEIIVVEYEQSDRFSWLLSRNEDRTYALELQIRRSF